VQLNPTPTVTQEIKAIGDALYMEISITNDSTGPFFLEKISPVRERTMGPEFSIKSGENELAFIGAMAKRKPYQKTDFFELKAGKSEHYKIRIDLDYQFLSGKYEYEASYIYLIYNPSTDNIISAMSPRVKFEYTRHL